MTSIQRFEAKMKRRDAQEKNVPATAKEIQEQSEHLGDKKGPLVQQEKLPNRADRRLKERPDNEGKILNNRGNAGPKVHIKMAMFGMKLANYRLGLAKTGTSKAR